MSDWLFYVRMGIDHIWSEDAYDHILFLLAICATYKPKAWRELLVLVTAFTIGHALTIFLASMYGSALSQPVTEWLVGLTIVLGAIYNLAFSAEWHQRHRWLNYVIVIGFGLIHGLAFSGMFRALAFEGGDLLGVLLGFNLGVEAGQIGIVLLIFGLSWLVVKQLKVPFTYWRIGLSVVALMYGLYLVWERWGF
ncbi:MAG: HupE/UreJ family protein [Bacteroidota bacterium]